MDCSPPGSSVHGDFSRQEYWSGLPCLPPGDFPNPGIEPRSPALQVDSLPAKLPGKPSEGWTHEELCCSLVNTAPQSPSRCLGARYSREDLPFWKRVPVHATLTCLNTSPLAELLQTLLNPRHSTDVEDNQVSLARR